MASSQPDPWGRVKPPSAACLKAGWLRPVLCWAPARDFLGLESHVESLVFLVATVHLASSVPAGPLHGSSALQRHPVLGWDSGG